MQWNECTQNNFYVYLFQAQSHCQSLCYTELRFEAKVTICNESKLPNKRIKK